MFTLHRADERQHVQVFVQEIWRTFPPDVPDQAAEDGEDAPTPRGGGFGALVVLDESRLSPGAQVALRPDSAAETITYVLKGALAQDDAKGHTRVVGMGEFQRMTLDSSARCYERNASQTDPVHFLRLSLHPAAYHADNTLEQRFYTVAERRGRLCVVGSQDGRKQSLRLFQDTTILSAVLSPGHHVIHKLPPDRMAWLHVVHGEATLGEIVVATGDGVGLAGQPAVSVTAREETEILLIDLARTLRASARVR